MKQIHGRYASYWNAAHQSTVVASVSLRVKIGIESDIAQTIIVDTRYCPNMKKYLVLVLFMLFTAGAFAQLAYETEAGNIPAF